MGAVFLTDFGPIVESDAGGGGADGADGVDGVDGEDGVGVPTGGTDGQVLTKTSGVDFATAWEDPTGGGGFEPILTIPSEDTVLAEDHDFASDWPTTDKILFSGYGGTVTYGATADYPETPRVVGDESSYVEYYTPPVEVGPGELWEFGIQYGITYGAGPSGFCAVNLLPITLDNAREIRTYQYPPNVDNNGNGYVAAQTLIWLGVVTAHILTTAADAEALFGIGLFHTGDGSGVITYYGGSTYARRLA